MPDSIVTTYGSHPDVVHFTLYMSKSEYEALDRLRELIGSDSIADTVERALKAYGCKLPERKRNA